MTAANWLSQNYAATKSRNCELSVLQRRQKFLWEFLASPRESQMNPIIPFQVSQFGNHHVHCSNHTPLTLFKAKFFPRIQTRLNTSLSSHKSIQVTPISVATNGIFSLRSTLLQIHKLSTKILTSSPTFTKTTTTASNNGNHTEQPNDDFHVIVHPIRRYENVASTRCVCDSKACLTRPSEFRKLHCRYPLPFQHQSGPTASR